MTETLTITYMKCSFCTAKNHCSACGVQALYGLTAQLSAALEEKPGVLSAQLNIPDNSLCIGHALDRDALEDLLDGMGLLVD